MNSYIPQRVPVRPVTHGELRNAMVSLIQWIEQRNFVGWDPYDALASPILLKLSLGNRWLALAITHAVKQSPINLRPLLGVPPSVNAKGMGLLLSICAELGDGFDDASLQDWPDKLIDKITSVATPTGSGLAWGYAFRWVNRYEKLDPNAPNAVVTAFVGNGLLDWYEVSGDARALELAMAAGAASHADFRWHSSNEGACISYTMPAERLVYNVNGLVLELLGRLCHHKSNSAWEARASAALRFSFAHQSADGSWPYGQSTGDQWVDHIHTGFLLKSLAAQQLTLSQQEQLARGLDFYWRELFTAAGLPKYRVDRAYPVDVHAVAQAILSYLTFSQRLGHPNLTDRAAALAAWAMQEMRNPDGSFIYQIRPIGRVSTPFLRWGQVWMLLALAKLYRALA